MSEQPEQPPADNSTVLGARIEAAAKVTHADGTTDEDEEA